MVSNIDRPFSRLINFRNALTAAVTVSILAVSVLAGGVSAASAKGRKEWREAKAATVGHSFSGMASYYGNESGSRTASGQRFNANGLTAAHRSLPFGTRVKVTHAGRSVVVTINDRGPFIRGRVLDLSTGAARVVGLTGRGVGRVVAEIQQ